jgi:hypothetical protein
MENKKFKPSQLPWKIGGVNNNPHDCMNCGHADYSDLHGMREIYSETDKETICWVSVSYSLDNSNVSVIAASLELYHELEKVSLLLRSYESHHLQKGDNEKANLNRSHAESCERILSMARGEHE